MTRGDAGLAAVRAHPSLQPLTTASNQRVRSPA